MFFLTTAKRIERRTKKMKVHIFIRNSDNNRRVSACDRTPRHVHKDVPTDVLRGDLGAIQSHRVIMIWIDENGRSRTSSGVDLVERLKKNVKRVRGGRITHMCIYIYSVGRKSRLGRVRSGVVQGTFGSIFVTSQNRRRSLDAI